MRFPLGLAFIMMALLVPLPIMADEPDSLGAARELGTGGSAGGSLRRASTNPTMPLAEAALADVRDILSRNNSCSSFFGGTGEVVAVLDGLAGRIQSRKLGNRYIGITMSGVETTFVSYLTGYQYRLFKNVIINTDGPFYNRGNAFFPQSRCGSFWPNTREARVLMLLHELGHLIKSVDGKWLLPDDGDSDLRSLMNTRTVEAKCMAQIKALQARDGVARKSETDAGHKR